VMDVQINDFVLGLFPADFVERRRAEGIAMTSQPIDTGAADLRRFTCDFRIPGEVLPMFVIGKPLATLAMGAAASVRLIDGNLTVLIDNTPSFRLERISDDRFSIVGLPPGITLQFHEQEHVVREVVLDLKGLPKDLFSARLGMYRGPAIEHRQVKLPVTSAGIPAGVAGQL